MVCSMWYANNSSSFLVPCCWAMESLIKPKTENRKQYLQSKRCRLRLTKNIFLRNAHLLGHQKLLCLPNPATCKCCLKIPQRSWEAQTRGHQTYYVFPYPAWAHPIWAPDHPGRKFSFCSSCQRFAWSSVDDGRPCSWHVIWSIVLPPSDESF